MCDRRAGFMSSVHYSLFVPKSVASNDGCEKLKPQFPQDLSRHSQTCLHTLPEWHLTSSNTCRSGYSRSLMPSWATGCPTCHNIWIPLTFCITAACRLRWRPTSRLLVLAWCAECLNMPWPCCCWWWWWGRNPSCTRNVFMAVIFICKRNGSRQENVRILMVVLLKYALKDLAVRG
jgi:hypothetical protein